MYGLKLEKRKIFKLVFGLCVFLLILFNTGCSHQESTSNKSSSKNNVVTIMGYYDESLMKPILKAVNQETHHKYKIQYTYVTLSQFSNVVNTQLASGNGPDLLQAESNFPALIKGGYVVDLSKKSYIQNYKKNAFSETTDSKGRIYGVPTYGWFDGYWYNKDIFKKYNLKAPTTFDEYLHICKVLKSHGIIPQTYGLSNGETGLQSLAGFLENTYYMDNPKIGKENDLKFANGEIGLSSYLKPSVTTWKKKLIDTGYITADMVGLPSSQAFNKFLNGKCAMYISGPWDYNKIKATGMNFGMFPPVGNNKKEHAMVGGPAASVGLNKASANKPSSQAVMKAMASKRVQKAWLKANPGGFSYYKGISAPFPKEYKLIKKSIEDDNIYIIWDRWGTNMPVNTLLTEIKKDIQGLVNGSQTPEEFLYNVDQKADRIRYRD